ncbi:MAG TPA: nitroreductase family protein [Pseudomonadales bacterium]
MSQTISLSPDELLTTTRAVRKRLDFERPVSLELIRECLEIALQAPTGSNAQGWQWVVVQDAAKRLALAELYRKAWAIYPSMAASAHQVHASDPTMTDIQAKVVSSAEYLANNLEKAPAFLIPCISGRVESIPAPMGVVAQASTYGSILPAVWSFMLAARARGLGTAWTTLHLFHESEAAEILGIPYADITQCALIPIAYSKGTDFRPGPRKALDPILHVDRW